MSQTFKPDSKYIIKCILVSFLSLIASFALLGGLGHLIAHSNDRPEAIPMIWLITGIAFLVCWIVSIPCIVLWVHSLEYIVMEERVTIHKGVLTKVQKNIPVRAVTDFILERSLLDRMLGIGTVKVQTAGQSHTSSGYEGKLAGLLAYQPLHEDLRSRIGRLHPIQDVPLTSEEKEASVMAQILKELVEIRKNTAHLRK